MPNLCQRKADKHTERGRGKERLRKRTIFTSAFVLVRLSLMQSQFLVFYRKDSATALAECSFITALKNIEKEVNLWLDYHNHILCLTKLKYLYLNITFLLFGVSKRGGKWIFKLQFYRITWMDIYLI